MRTIKVNAGQNKEVFDSIARLLENEEANVRKTGSPRFYEASKAGKAGAGGGADGADFVVDAKRSDSTRIVFSTPEGMDDIAYELDDGSPSCEGLAGFTPEGASWFANLREGNAEPIESPESDWAGRRDSIADAYHRKYFTIEYVIDQDMDEKAAHDYAKAVTDALGEAIYNDGAAPADAAAQAAVSASGKGAGVGTAAPQPANAGAKARSLLELGYGTQKSVDETYYSAKLKVNASFGVGQPIPLIGRIYYRYDGRKDSRHYGYTMLTRDSAKSVEDSLSNISEDGSSSSMAQEERLDQGAISDTLRTRLETDLNAPDGAEMFSECFLFSEQSMEVLKSHKKDGEIQGDGSTVTLSLQCKSIELVSVAKIMWPNICYTLLHAGKEAFSLTYSMTGITLRCIACGGDCKEGEDALIAGDFIVFPEGSGLAGKYCICSRNPDGSQDRSPEGIKKALERFLSANVVKGGKYVSAFSLSNFSKHLSLKPTCREAEPRGACAGRKICECQRLEARKEVCLCKRCPRPENVFLNADSSSPDRYIATDSLFFDAMDGKMKPKVSERNYECSVCGRFFDGSADVFKDEKPDLNRTGPNNLPLAVCPTCNKLVGNISADEEKECTELYKRYKGILSLGTRIAGVRGKPRCAENERYIMFRVGKSIYRFDKLLVTDTGYIKAARKVPGSFNVPEGGAKS